MTDMRREKRFSLVWAEEWGYGLEQYGEWLDEPGGIASPCTLQSFNTVDEAEMLLQSYLNVVAYDKGHGVIALIDSRGGYRVGGPWPVLATEPSFVA